jgi:uncharacterized protein (TIGR00290 family)
MSDARASDGREPVLVAWGGGKESVMALRWALAQPELRVESLVTTVTEDADRISTNGVRRELLRAQAAALGLPVEEVDIPRQASNAEYERAMGGALAKARARGVRRVVFGDLLLEDVRAHRERLLAGVDMAGLFPLWDRDTRKLAHEVIDAGLQAILVCVDPDRLDPFFCGRDFDWPMLADLPAWTDMCGERGEFRTFVWNGPGFRQPVPVERGPIDERDGLVFCDLRPAGSAAAERVATPEAD